jgi:hypothetical protein
MVNDLSFEQTGNSLKTDMRMRRNVHRLTFGKQVGAVPVEKAPGPDESFSFDRQRSKDLLAPEICVPTGEAFDNLLAST